tara:strand:- start:102 stop:203 length:102 start_codon:yes stop_codon:yes gene_type:complete
MQRLAQQIQEVAVAVVATVQVAIHQVRVVQALL